MELHFATIWEALADAIPDHTALVHGSVRRSWRAFDDRAARLAGALREAGLGPGSAVALCLYNGPEYLEAFFACLKIRAVPCNVNYRYLDRELGYLLDDSDAEAIVFHSSLGPRVERALTGRTGIRMAVEVRDDDTRLADAHPYEDLATGAPAAARIHRPADDHYLFYTGGTTGLPKGVIRPLRPTVERIVQVFPARLGYGEHERAETLVATARARADAGHQLASIPAAPLMHHTGLGLGATPALTAGGRVVLLTGRHFDADELWDAVERERVDAMAIVGDAFARPMLAALGTRERRTIDSLRLVLSAGVMFSAEVKAALLEHLPRAQILDFIASTEAAAGISVATAGNVPPTGRFTPYPGVILVGDDGAVVPPGSKVPGRLAVPGRFGGYRGDDAKTAAVTLELDGAVYTLPGDVAVREDNGTITLLGRGSACINTGGEKVFPEEVEEAAKRDPAVDDCLVFGVPDERFGQKVVAVVSLHAGRSVEPADLISRLRGELAAYKLPRAVVVLEQVPRAPSGKPDYAAARAEFEQRSGAASSPRGV